MATRPERREEPRPLCAHCQYPHVATGSIYCLKCAAWIRCDWQTVRAIDAGKTNPRGAA